MIETKPRLLRLALMDLLFYAVDMGCAIGGFVYGFGLTVHSWWAVLGFMVLSRWVTLIARRAFELTRQRHRQPQGGSNG